MTRPHTESVLGDDDWAETRRLAAALVTAGRVADPVEAERIVREAEGTVGGAGWVAWALAATVSSLIDSLAFAQARPADELWAEMCARWES